MNKNKIVSIGFNQVKTHPKSNNRYKMLHAEISCLIGLDFEKSKGCTAYIYRETRNGIPAIAKPCDACHMALKLAGIKKCFYTIENSWKEMTI